jgi:ABC-type sugar transport system substrate-binding protein
MAGKTWRRMGTVMAVAVLTLVLAACNRGTSSNATGGGGGGGSGSSAGKTAAVIKGLDNPFFQAMQQGIEEQNKAQGTTVSVQAATSITDTTGQADKLNALAGQDYSCYLVNPISGTNLVQSLVQISQKNKPIVNIDSPVDAKAAQTAGVKLATYIGTNNVTAGETAGQQMLKELSGGGQVALIGGIAGDVTSAARLDGFKKAVTGKLDIAQTVAADWDRQKALTAATDILRARPNLKGFFAANDDMGLGIVRAVQNANKSGKIKVISVDGNKDALESVKQGQLTATVAQYPYAIGQMGMEACKAAAAGKQLPANVEAPVLLVTKDVADKAISNFPKPFGSFDDPLKSLAG